MSRLDRCRQTAEQQEERVVRGAIVSFQVCYDCGCAGGKAFIKGVVSWGPRRERACVGRRPNNLTLEGRVVYGNENEVTVTKESLVISLECLSTVSFRLHSRPGSRFPSQAF